MKRPHRNARAALALLALLLGAAGCYNPFDPRLASVGGSSKPPPVPDSPSGIVDLFQWCWQNRAYDTYQEIFTDNYRFVFATGDSAGDFYRGQPWTRADELATAQHLFLTGTPSQPPATSITLDWTQDLSIDIDPLHPVADSTYFRQITAQVLLRVNLTDGTQEVRGPVYFNVVRGDSAIIPPELVQRGFKQDSTRWYIQRWVDGTLQSGAFAVRRAPGLEPGAAAGQPALLRTAGGAAAGAGSGASVGAAPPVRRDATPLRSVSWGLLKVEFR
jgi:hypothetical protein